VLRYGATPIWNGSSEIHMGNTRLELTLRASADERLLNAISENGASICRPASLRHGSGDGTGRESADAFNVMVVTAVTNRWIFPDEVPADVVEGGTIELAACRRSILQ